jgi:HAD superfamily hydrolase (TIGR01509 family)
MRTPPARRDRTGDERGCLTGSAAGCDVPSVKLDGLLGGGAPRALLLDLDDTLFDRTAAFCSWLTARLGRAPAPEELERWLELDQRGHRPRAELAADAASLGVALDPDRFPFELAEHVLPEPGAREALLRLAARMRVAVVTNGGAAQRDKLARLGLADVVHAVFVSSELSCAKPASAIFEHALDWTEAAPHEVLFVGDDPIVDLAPAAAHGMVTAWRVRGEWPRWLALPAYQIHGIAALEELCGIGPRVDEARVDERGAARR